jgi:hypothetical protein
MSREELLRCANQWLTSQPKDKPDAELCADFAQDMVAAYATAFTQKIQAETLVADMIDKMTSETA